MSGVTVNNFLNQERSLLGLGEDPPGSNHNKITEWYGLTGPWCAMTISYCLQHAGYTDFRYAYVPFVVHDAEKGINGMQWLSHNAAARSGDLIIFDWDADGVADHIGVVEVAHEDGSVVTIEGNSGDPGMVQRNHWPDRKFVQGFVRLPLGIVAQASMGLIPDLKAALRPLSGGQQSRGPGADNQWWICRGGHRRHSFHLHEPP